METLLNRNFKVKGNINCLYAPGAITKTLQIANVEIQLWHKTPMQVILLGKSLTNSDGDFIIEFEVDSPVSYIVDGKIKNVFLEAYYNGEKLDINGTSSLLIGLIAYWKLDGNSNDSVHSNNGADTDITYSDANGIIHNGAGFNGSTSLISVPYSTSLNSPTTQLSVSAWIKIPSTQTSIPLIKYVASLSGDYWINVSPTVIGCATAGGTGSVNALADYDLNTWYHVAFTWLSDTLLSLYINGELQGTDNSPGTISSLNYNFELGNYPGSEFMGALDEIGLWSRALTPTEITQLYNWGMGLQYPFNYD